METKYQYVFSLWIDLTSIRTKFDKQK